MPLQNGENNILLTTDKIAPAVLVLLKNKLVFARLVYRKPERYFGDIGDTVNFRLPNNVVVNSGRVATTTTPLLDKVVSLTIDQQRNVKFNWTMKDRVLSIVEFSKRYLNPAANRLANELDIDVANKILQFYYHFGTVGSNLTVQDIAFGRAYARQVGIPDDGMSAIVVDEIDGAYLTQELKTLYNDKIVHGAVRKGYIGNIAGYDIYTSPNMPTHTVGNHAGTEQVAADLHYGNQLQVSNTQVGAFAVGDMFTIAGVYEINPITKQRTGRLATFTVLDKTPVDPVNLTTTLTISPTLNDGTGTITDSEGNTVSVAADQNVDGAALTGAAITVIGTANTTYRQAVILHKQSIGLAVIDIELPPEAHPSRARDPQSGLSLAVSHYWNGDQYQDSLRLDLLWGDKAIRPDLSLRALTSVV